MSKKKLILYIALGVVCFVLWSAWMSDYGKAAATKNVTTKKTVVVSAGSKQATKAAVVAMSKVPSQRLIRVKTDVLNVSIDTKGGNIVQASLLKYSKSLKQKNIPVQILNSKAQNFYVAQSGLVGKGGPDSKTSQAQYHSSARNYQLKQNQDQLVVNLTWKNPQGLLVTKNFVFKRNSYAIGVNYNIKNNSLSAWRGSTYAQITRVNGSKDKHGFFGMRSYTGAAISSAKEPYEKISFESMHKENLNRIVLGGWIAMQQRYFVSAFVPQKGVNYHYYSRTKNNLYTIGFRGPEIAVPKNASREIKSNFYVGPEISEKLGAVAKNLDRTVDYGWLWIVSVLIFKVMNGINKFIGNWGWSIVIVTLIIKLVFYKLSETSYKSMARMKTLAPKFKEIKERYGNDKQKVSQETMALYKKEKVNPLGGCLPMIVQIPIFIALYYVLLEAVQLRQAPFIFWIHDLAAKDPYYILPVLMGLSMLAQQKLNPAPPDPTQAKMMMLMPVVFTVLFAAFPSGLVLYWLVNNVLSALQQWYIMRKMETAKK